MTESNDSNELNNELNLQFSKFLGSLDPTLLVQLIPPSTLLDLSFYNFKNAITACYFADCDFKVNKVNETFMTFFSDKNKEEIEGKHLTDVLSIIGVNQDTIEVFMSQLDQKGWVTIPQIEVVSNGETRYFSLFSTFTEQKGIKTLSGIQGQFIDRTKEVLLKKRQESLASQIRHDMKNRISASLMGSDAVIQEWEMLKPKIKTADKMKYFFENMEETLKEIYTNSDYLSNLVLQMLDVSKLQDGQLSLKVSKFDIKEALSQVISALKPQQEERKIVVSMETESFEIEADFVQLSRVLENYHSNGIKYAKSKLDWKIQKTDDNQLLIVLQDDGEGIPQEYIKRIFDPFFQVPGKEKKGSTGLGLDSVNDLVKLHNGITWAESEGPGKGSQFCLKIPITNK